MQLHHHNPEQQQLLNTLIAELAGQLLSFQFNDPAQDHLMLRQHAYIKGKLDLATQLLQDTYPDPEPETQED
jgi:hypothetical protein